MDGSRRFAEDRFIAGFGVRISSPATGEILDLVTTGKWLGPRIAGIRLRSQRSSDKLHVFARGDRLRADTSIFCFRIISAFVPLSCHIKVSYRSLGRLLACLHAPEPSTGVPGQRKPVIGPN